MGMHDSTIVISKSHLDTYVSSRCCSSVDSIVLTTAVVKLYLFSCSLFVCDGLLPDFFTGDQLILT